MGVPYASSLDHPEQRTKLPVSTAAKALYAPPDEGRPAYLLWLRERTLVAHRFEPSRLKLEGDPTPVAEQIRVGGGIVMGLTANRAAFWISANGLLVYRVGAATGRTLTWFGADGKPQAQVAQEERDGEFANPRLSPDGFRLAVARTVSDTTDVWIYEIMRGVKTKLTSAPGNETFPVWSYDGRQIAFAAERDGRPLQIYRIDTNGAGQEVRLTDGANAKLPHDWSRDGRYLLYGELHPQNQIDLWILPLEGSEGAPGKPIPFLTTPASETSPRLSPDGKWIAYLSNATGRNEAYIRAFPGAGPPGEWPVSNGGAANLAWRKDGKELFYTGPSPTGGGQMAASIRLLADRVEIGAPRELFSGLNSTFAVSDDGQRFLRFVQAGVNDDRDPLTVVLNWPGLLK